MSFKRIACAALVLLSYQASAQNSHAIYDTQLADCQDSGGNHVNYTTSTGIFSCGTSNNNTFSGTEPRIILNESDQGADLKIWDVDLNSAVLLGRTRTDADGAGVNWLAVTRGTTTSITDISLGNATNNPTFHLLGNGVVTITGNISSNSSITTTGVTQGGRVQVTASTAASNGIYLPATNTLGFSTNGIARGNFDPNGALNLNSALISTGTKFTASGCSNTTTVGGATSGQFASGTTGTCTVTITLPTAPNGWYCGANDLTTPADRISQSASSTTSCTITGTTVSGDTINFMGGGY